MVIATVERKMTTVPDCGKDPYHCEKVDEISPSHVEQRASDKDSTAAACSNFDCSICLEVSQDPVVTMCGHLFCWPCLNKWISIHSVQEECPVCKASVKGKIIPLYGRGKTGFDGKSESKELLEFDVPRRPSAPPTYAASVRVPRNSSFHYHSFIGQQGNGFIAQGNFSASSVAASGLFPALFGVHMVTSPNYSTGNLHTTTVNPLSVRMPTVRSTSSPQWRLISQQEFFLHWCLILLAGFATLCFLFC